MNILALETTETIGSLAALSDGKVLRELNLDPSKRTAQSLAPGMARLIDDVGWRPRDVSLVATTIGPGSFTGLRIGLCAAKVFAYCVGADILGIDTLEAIAAAAPPDVRCLAVAMDAERGQVAAVTFERAATGWFRSTGPWQLLHAEEWMSGIPPGVSVAGPALRRFAGRMPSHLVLLDREFWSPTAAAVGRLAARYAAQGRRDDLWTLSPVYARRSAAEEKWDQKRR